MEVSNHNISIIAALMLTTVLLLSVKVTLAQNHPPVAEAGPDQSIYLGESAMLEGLATDPDGDRIVSWSWKIYFPPPGTPPQLLTPNSSIATLIPHEVGRYIVLLVVSDGIDESVPDTVVVSVTEEPHHRHDRLPRKQVPTPRWPP